jgi:hypothetical protein
MTLKLGKYNLFLGKKCSVEMGGGAIGARFLLFSTSLSAYMALLQGYSVYFTTDLNLVFYKIARKMPNFGQRNNQYMGH